MIKKRYAGLIHSSKELTFDDIFGLKEAGWT